jgi:hypothetical protein
VRPFRLHSRILGLSARILKRVANVSPALALVLNEVVDRVGLVPAFSPEQIVEAWARESIPPRELQRISRSMRLIRAKNHALGKVPPERLAPIIRLRGVEFLRQQAGRPTILVFWHLGASPLFIAPAMANERVPIVAARAEAVASLNSQFVRSVAVHSSEGRRHFLNQATATLLEGGTILMAADGRERRRGLQVRLFGRPAWLARGFVILARTTRAAVVPVMSMYRGCRIEVRVHPPLISDGEANGPCSPSEADQRLADSAAAWLESYLRRHPEQMVSTRGLRALTGLQ